MPVMDVPLAERVADRAGGRRPDTLRLGRPSDDAAARGAAGMPWLQVSTALHVAAALVLWRIQPPPLPVPPSAPAVEMVFAAPTRPTPPASPAPSPTSPAEAAPAEAAPAAAPSPPVQAGAAVPTPERPAPLPRVAPAAAPRAPAPHRPAASTRPAPDTQVQAAPMAPEPAASATAAAQPAGAGTPPPSAVISPVWREALATWLQTHKVYPDLARRRGEEGRAVLRFTVARGGQVLDVTLLHSTGSDALDQAAQALLRGAAVPPFPPGMTQPAITVTVPIRYELER